MAALWWWQKIQGYFMALLLTSCLKGNIFARIGAQCQERWQVCGISAWIVPGAAHGSGALLEIWHLPILPCKVSTASNC
jgi:hypothetical protein